MELQASRSSMSYVQFHVHRPSRMTGDPGQGTDFGLSYSFLLRWNTFHHRVSGRIIRSHWSMEGSATYRLARQACHFKSRSKFLFTSTCGVSLQAHGVGCSIQAQAPFTALITARDMRIKVSSIATKRQCHPLTSGSMMLNNVQRPTSTSLISQASLLF
ncbi:hypothetical protein BDN67DRAFT_615281 [Paxillus ammoniavirescens]|nr:hypothetical protein BDN67DRAFT_615281 [Paxillus ammoniavirescens]